MLTRSVRSSRTQILRLNSLRRTIVYDAGKYEHLEPEQDRPLRTDIKTLGNILGSAIRHESEEVYDAVEILRHLGREVLS
jgi:hypothetical protein